MTQPNLPGDELLSAYLDGELSAEQRADFQRRLAEDPQCRQLVDELRTLSAGLKNLPRQPLPADFAQRVLQRAEQAMLAGEAKVPSDTVPTDAVPTDAVPAAMPQVMRPGLDRVDEPRRGWRPVAWSAAAIAVALALMVLAPRYDRQPREVAQQPPLPETGRSSQAQFRAAGGPAAAEGRNGINAAGEHVAAEADLAQFEPEVMPAEKEMAAKSDGSIAPPGAVAPSVVRDADEVVRKAHSEKATATPSAAAARSVHVAPPAADTAESSVPQGQAFGAGLAADATAALRTRSAAETPLESWGDDTVVYYFEVSPQAVESGQFEQLLARHQIELVDQRREVERRAIELRKDGSSAAAAQPNAPPAPTTAPLAQAARERDKLAPAEERRAANGLDRGTAPAQVEVLLVEAPPERLAALLADARTTFAEEANQAAPGRRQMLRGAALGAGSGGGQGPALGRAQQEREQKSQSADRATDTAAKGVSAEKQELKPVPADQATAPLAEGLADEAAAGRPAAGVARRLQTAVVPGSDKRAQVAGERAGESVNQREAEAGQQAAVASDVKEADDQSGKRFDRANTRGKAPAVRRALFVLRVVPETAPAPASAPAAEPPAPAVPEE